MIPEDLTQFSIQLTRTNLKRAEQCLRLFICFVLPYRTELPFWYQNFHCLMIPWLWININSACFCFCTFLINCLSFFEGYKIICFNKFDRTIIATVRVRVCQKFLILSGSYITVYWLVSWSPVSPRQGDTSATQLPAMRLRLALLFLCARVLRDRAAR